MSSRPKILGPKCTITVEEPPDILRSMKKKLGAEGWVKHAFLIFNNTVGISIYESYIHIYIYTYAYICFLGRYNSGHMDMK